MVAAAPQRLTVPPTRASIVAAPAVPRSANTLDMLWAVRDVVDERLKTTHRLLLLALPLFAERNGDLRPSVGQLERATGLGESTIRRALSELETFGLLVVTRSKGGHAPSAYELVIPPRRSERSRGETSRSGTSSSETSRSGTGGVPLRDLRGPAPGPSEDLSEDLSEDRERARDAGESPAAPEIPAERPSGMQPVSLPADIPITKSLEDACLMAGARKPTRHDVQLMLAAMREKRKTSPDYTASVVKWMLRQKGYDRPARASPASSGVQPRASKPAFEGAKPLTLEEFE